MTITTQADRPDLERALYDLDMLVQPEIPFLANEPAPSFEAWQTIGTSEVGYLRDLSLIALEDDRVIGVIQMYDNADETLFIGMTTVHPDARRRGIARLLKVELARRARAAGLAPHRDLQRRLERRGSAASTSRWATSTT